MDWRKAMSVILVSGAAALGCSHEKAAVKEAAPALPPAPPPRMAAADTPKSAEAPADNAVYFDFDAAMLRDEARPVLQQVADKIKVDPNSKVRIEGNCDERGTSEYNLALGAHRAQAAKKYLESLGVAGKRIETVSYGSERPKLTGHDEDAWSKNRRDDLMLK